VSGDAIDSEMSRTTACGISATNETTPSAPCIGQSPRHYITNMLFDSGPPDSAAYTVLQPVVVSAYLGCGFSQL